MLSGIHRNEERQGTSRHMRDLAAMLATQQELMSEVREVKSLMTTKKAKVSAPKSDLFPTVDTEGFAKLLSIVRAAGPVRTGGGNAALHFRRLLVKFCHTRRQWSYNPKMRKKLAIVYFRVLESLHGDDLKRLKVDTLSDVQTNVFITKFISPVVDHNITQFRSHAKGKIKDFFCMAYGVPRVRCAPFDPDDPFGFDLQARNITINHDMIDYVVKQLFGDDLLCMGSDTGQCNNLIQFLFTTWNELRNWSGYGAHAPSFNDIAWILTTAEDSFIELQSEDQKKKCVFCTSAFSCQL